MHFSKFFDAYGSGVRSYHRDIWALLVDGERFEAAFDVLIVTGDSAGRVQVADENDVGRIVKPKDVPDYVWARIAFYKLMGVVDAD